jgi:hypothetical protein
MERLSDFKPLGHVRLPRLGDVLCSGLVVLVGPNSSGKSQLLQDICKRLVGEPRQLVVAEDIRIEKPPYEDFMRCLQSEGYFSMVEDDSGQQQLRPLTLYLGTGQAVGQIAPSQAQTWSGSFSPESLASHKRKDEFLNYFGRMLVTALFLERRLTALSPAGLIDFVNQPPQHDLHALYIDDSARERLLEEMRNSFNRAVWPDMSRGNAISLKVSDEGILPSAADRLSHKKMEAFRSIETEGDGLKSYAATCISLLLGRRPVCIIDEPEMCLHPPQAYNLGRFIGRHGASQETATFVATHSSHLLRGIIQTARQVQIVRLSRHERLFDAHLVPAHELEDALPRPTLRAEAVLDGIFAQGIIVVEADGDRLVYQAAWETIQSEFRIDVHFSTVGGTGGISDTCRLYRTLRIPIAVIADLDMLMDAERIRRVLQSLIGDPSLQDAIFGECKQISEQIRRIPPLISASELANELDSVRCSSMNWDAGEDDVVKRRLRELTTRLDRMGRLKRGGVTSYSDNQLGARISDLLQKLTAFGLFLVPVGELEEWLASHSVGESKSNKRAWANAAAQRIQKLGKQSDDVWEFVSSVVRYLVLQGA